LRAGKFTGVVLAAAVAAGQGVAAHRLDECLQAARIDIAPDRITLELDVTPGVAIAETLLPEIDRNRDGEMADDERQAYVRRVLDAVDLAIDGRPLDITTGTGVFPDTTALRNGVGTIRLRTSVAISSQAAGRHQVSFSNRYRGDVSVYLANALVPESDRIAVSAQRHSAEQRDIVIEYTVSADTPTVPWSWLLALAAVALAIVAVWSPSRRDRLHISEGSAVSASHQRARRIYSTPP
jgi:hypothetical protein